MSCEGQIFSGVQWSLLSERVADLSRRVGALEKGEAIDPATNRAILRAASRAFEELLVFLEPFVKETEHHPHIADTHRRPVGA